MLHHQLIFSVYSCASWAASRSSSLTLTCEVQSGRNRTLSKIRIFEFRVIYVVSVQRRRRYLKNKIRNNVSSQNYHCIVVILEIWRKNRFPPLPPPQVPSRKKLETDANENILWRRHIAFSSIVFHPHCLLGNPYTTCVPNNRNFAKRVRGVGKPFINLWYYVNSAYEGNTVNIFLYILPSR
jgi:hypothetical protein